LPQYHGVVQKREADVVSANIFQAMNKAARDADRNSQDIELIAVSKQQPEDKIETALSDGFRIFGENRVQEAQTRWANRRALFPDLRLHLIGPLQSNKAADAVALFDVIHTVDREKIAKTLSLEMTRQKRQLDCFIQVNTGEEPQKAGIHPKDLPAFTNYCQSEQGLSIIGLMCIPPIDENPAIHFGFLKHLAGQAGLKGLSMGMSADFETAIAFGATHIRVGSAIFGDRLAR